MINGMSDFDPVDQSTWDPVDPLSGYKLGEAISGELSDMLKHWNDQRLLPAMQWLADQGQDPRVLLDGVTALLDRYTSALDKIAKGK